MQLLASLRNGLSLFARESIVDRFPFLAEESFGCLQELIAFAAFGHSQKIAQKQQDEEG